MSKCQTPAFHPG